MVYAHRLGAGGLFLIVIRLAAWGRLGVGPLALALWVAVSILAALWMGRALYPDASWWTGVALGLLVGILSYLRFRGRGG